MTGEINWDAPTEMAEVIYALRFIAAGHPEDREPPTMEGLIFAAWNGMYGAGEDGESVLTEKGQDHLDRFGFLSRTLHAKISS